MNTTVFIWEMALLSSLFILLLMMQDWSNFWLFKKYLEKKQYRKDKIAAEKLLDDLPQGIIRYKKAKFNKKNNSNS